MDGFGSARLILLLYQFAQELFELCSPISMSYLPNRSLLSLSQMLYLCSGLHHFPLLVFWIGEGQHIHRIIAPKGMIVQKQASITALPPSVNPFLLPLQGYYISR